MTIYLWHLPVIIAVAGVALLAPPLSPAPGSVAWWLTRIVVFVVVLALVLLVSMPLARFETAPTTIPDGFRRPDAASTWVAAALTLLPAFAVMQFFLDLPIALIGAGSLTIALWLLRSRCTRNA